MIDPHKMLQRVRDAQERGDPYVSFYAHEAANICALAGLAADAQALAHNLRLALQEPTGATKTEMTRLCNVILGL